MKVLNWIILACTFIAGIGAEVSKDRAKYRDALKADPATKFDMAKAGPRWFRGAIYGMIGGTAFNEAVLPALQGMGGD